MPNGKSLSSGLPKVPELSWKHMQTIKWWLFSLQNFIHVLNFVIQFSFVVLQNGPFWFVERDRGNFVTGNILV